MFVTDRGVTQECWPRDVQKVEIRDLPKHHRRADHLDMPDTVVAVAVDLRLEPGSKCLVRQFVPVVSSSDDGIFSGLTYVATLALSTLARL